MRLNLKELLGLATTLKEWSPGSIDDQELQRRIDLLDEVRPSRDLSDVFIIELTCDA